MRTTEIDVDTSVRRVVDLTDGAGPVLRRPG